MNNLELDFNEICLLIPLLDFGIQCEESMLGHPRELPSITQIRIDAYKALKNKLEEIRNK